MNKMRYLHKTPEEQLIDLSLKEPTLLMMSPLAQIFQYIGISLPKCWIGIRMPTDKLKEPLHSVRHCNDYKIPGDLDIIGGHLSDGIPSDYIVGIEIKRFRYLYSPDNRAWVVKNPDSYGREQARGYSVFGFNKIMLCHFVVAEPIDHQDYNPWLLNASIIADGMQAVKKKRIKIKLCDPFGYCIIGWSQVSFKDPLYAGSFRGPEIIKSTPENHFLADINFKYVQKALLQQVQRKLKELNSDSLPIILRF
ncbi:MAG: hypothetical protein HY096_02060 [Nitrospinae bacterium]|nr:hypothetical protein [Nitrospinota bacterium]MBI3815168.1 hypothetical protein [Nitrospinota bacterium]